MYHVGKVMEIFAADDKNVVGFDNTVQVMLDMWDENLITLVVDSHIGRMLKKDDIVLADYTPTQTGPKMVVVKILKGELAKRTWKQYREHLEKMRSGKNVSLKNVNIDKQSYVG